MSAFIVGKVHIDAILRVAIVHIPGSQFHWYYHEEHRDLTDPDAIGGRLVAENAASVHYRYPQDPIDGLPGPTDAYWMKPYFYSPFGGRVPTVVEGLKLIKCYEYQSCEHPNWETSEAKAFCDALKEHLIRHLPGYDDAPWEWRE